MTAGFLLDTSVLSLLAPGRPTLDDTFSGWLREHEDRLYICAVTVAEIEQGIQKLHRTGSVERAHKFALWLDALLEHGGERVLPFDTKSGRLAGALSDRALAQGRHPGFADIAIAATADAYGLLLLTRNGKHFAPLGIPFADPLEGLPRM